MESAVSTLRFPWDKGLLDRIHSLPEPLFGESLSLNKHNCHGSLTLPASRRKMRGGGQAKPQGSNRAVQVFPKCLNVGTACPQPHSSSHSSQGGTAGGNSQGLHSMEDANQPLLYSVPEKWPRPSTGSHWSSRALRTEQEPSSAKTNNSAYSKCYFSTQSLLDTELHRLDQHSKQVHFKDSLVSLSELWSGITEQPL